jgi:hypothetical protein
MKKLTVIASFVALVAATLFFGVSYKRSQADLSGVETKLARTEEALRVSSERAKAASQQNLAMQVASERSSADVIKRTAVIPKAMLKSLKVILLNEQGQLSDQFLMATGTSREQAGAVDQKLADTRQKLDDLANQRTTLTANKRGFDIRIDSFSQQGAELKQALLAQFQAVLDEDSYNLVLPQVSDQLDRKMGYFGKYPQEINVIRAAELPESVRPKVTENRYVVVQRVVFDSARQKAESTSVYAGLDDLRRKFPSVQQQM